MNSIVIFCGSSEGYNEIYRETAYDVGTMLASREIEIIYGGSKVGLMGAVADGALLHGGKVVGIIPYFLKHKEVVHEGITELLTVNSMHERKLMMHQRSEGIIALPGGWGTLEELFEMLTWSQLGLHKKPIGLLNINGYYDALTAFTTSMVTEGFLDEAVHNSLLVSDSLETLLEMMNNYTPPPVPRWLSEKLI